MLPKYPNIRGKVDYLNITSRGELWIWKFHCEDRAQLYFLALQENQEHYDMIIFVIGSDDLGLYTPRYRLCSAKGLDARLWLY